MSTMLEQAIIDAAALRETAMKSAEATLVEKYKDVFEETVNKLLEQEMQPETAAANAADPTGPVVAQDASTPVAAPTVPSEDPNKKDVFEKVKTAFFDLDGDDEELITINFDQLKAKPVNKSLGAGQITPLAAPEQSALLSAPTSTETPEAPLSEEIELDLESLSEGLKVRIGEYANPGDDSYHRGQVEEEELELDEEELEESAASLAMKKDAGNLKQQAAKKEADAIGMEADDQAKVEQEAEKQRLAKQKADAEAKSESLEEEIELTEEELLELEESLKVDMEEVSDGYYGSTKKKQREFKKLSYAKARDDKETARREKAKKTLADLQETLKYTEELFYEEKNKSESLEKTNTKLLSAVSALKEQMEQVNLSNAKLLYTNKVLSNNSLNERQKQNIVENITKADSVTEAKTIYETLQSTVQSVSSQKTPKSLSEALNRGPSPFLVRKTQTASINDLMAERMKRLAGIQK